MNIIKLICSLVGAVLAALLCLPLAFVVLADALNMYQARWFRPYVLTPSLSIGGDSFHGWEVWLIALIFALIGIGCGMFGYYLFTSRRSTA